MDDFIEVMGLDLEGDLASSHALHIQKITDQSQRLTRVTPDQIYKSQDRIMRFATEHG